MLAVAAELDTEANCELGEAEGQLSLKFRSTYLHGSTLVEAGGRLLSQFSGAQYITLQLLGLEELNERGGTKGDHGDHLWD